jgi:hypothetical protein
MTSPGYFAPKGPRVLQPWTLEDRNILAHLVRDRWVGALGDLWVLVCVRAVGLIRTTRYRRLTRRTALARGYWRAYDGEKMAEKRGVIAQLGTKLHDTQGGGETAYWIGTLATALFGYGGLKVCDKYRAFHVVRSVIEPS